MPATLTVVPLHQWVCPECHDEGILSMSLDFASGGMEAHNLIEHPEIEDEDA